jgi:pyruvate-formate lyase
MTLSTDKKNIEKIVRGILQSNGIDNFKLEIDLSSAWHRYVTTREGGLTPAESRLQIAQEYNEIGFSAKGQERNQLKQEFMDVMKIDFGGEDSADWTSLLDHLVKAKAKGETIQTFAEWCKKDPFNSPKIHQIAQKPLLVKQVWAAAFIQPETKSREFGL